MGICIFTINETERIEPLTLFGKDSKAFLMACRNIYKNVRHFENFESRYSSPFRPRISDIRKEYPQLKVSELVRLCRDMQFEWEGANPEEVEKEQQSKREWKRFCDKQFRILYGIAKRHHMHVHWHGNDEVARCPDKWTLSKNGTVFARVCYV